MAIVAILIGSSAGVLADTATYELLAEWGGAQRLSLFRGQFTAQQPIWQASNAPRRPSAGKKGEFCHKKRGGCDGEVVISARCLHQYYVLSQIY